MRKIMLAVAAAAFIVAAIALWRPTPEPEPVDPLIAAITTINTVIDGKVSPSTGSTVTVDHELGQPPTTVQVEDRIIDIEIGPDITYQVAPTDDGHVIAVWSASHPTNTTPSTALVYDSSTKATTTGPAPFIIEETS